MATTIYYYIKDNKIYDMSYVLDKSLDDFQYRTIPKKWLHICKPSWQQDKQRPSYSGLTRDS